MDRVKNGNNKTVCYVNGYKKIVEIIKKGERTVVSFNEDNTYNVVNSKVNDK